MGSVPMDWQTPRQSRSTSHYNNKDIFVVHGHDELAKYTLSHILQADFHLNPIILNEQPNAGMTLIEKVQKYGSSTKYAIVVLTPDDVGRDKNSQVFYHRARQNVILELGYFIGFLGRDRVCCVHKKEVELPSDFLGVAYLPFTESVNECYRGIEKELKNAGYLVS